MNDMQRWLARQPVRGELRLRLMCLPFAGGGAQIYRNYGQMLPAGVEVCAVQLPGRERRVGEPALTSVTETVAQLLPVMRRLVDLPYVVFGHSLGALTGFELVRGMRAGGLPLPLHLVVSAHRGPHLPDPGAPIHGLPDDAFVAELMKLNGTPPEVFAAPELRDLMLPLLRADFRSAETYVHTSEPPLACPITAFGGDADPLVAPAEIEGWRPHTSAGFDSHIFAGDHFFFQRAQPLFMHRLSAVIGGVLAGLPILGGVA